MKELFVLGRIILGSYLLYSGFHHFTDTAMLAHFAHAKGVPMAEAAILMSGALLIIAGVSFLLGMMPKVGIASAALFLLPVTLVMHQFWKEAGAARTADLVNFTKNFALLGAVLMLAAVPEPWPMSVGSRLLIGRRHRMHAFNH